MAVLGGDNSRAWFMSTLGSTHTPYLKNTSIFTPFFFATALNLWDLINSLLTRDWTQVHSSLDPQGSPYIHSPWSVLSTGPPGKSLYSFSMECKTPFINLGESECQKYYFSKDFQEGTVCRNKTISVFSQPGFSQWIHAADWKGLSSRWKNTHWVTSTYLFV